MTMEDAQVEERALNGVAETEDVVTPWTVTSVNDSGIDYDKLISKSRLLRKAFAFYAAKLSSMQVHGAIYAGKGHLIFYGFF